MKILQVGTNETVKVCWVQLLKSKFQVLCISIPGTLLHVTLKKRAEISADIFAGLLQYSCTNLTINKIVIRWGENPPGRYN